MLKFKHFLEEVEQIDEISKSTLASYKDKSTASLKNAQANRDAAEPGKHMSKGFADLHAKSDDIAKKRVKGLKGYLQRKVGMKPTSEEVELEELFDILEEVVDGIAEENNLDPDVLWENLEDVSDEELYETAAWRRKEGKSASGGLNAKGIASYRRENPGSKLKKAVTGKVKPGSKAAKRRKSFCARMGGMKGAMKKPNGEPTRKALALRKWKCR